MLAGWGQSLDDPGGLGAEACESEPGLSPIHPLKFPQKASSSRLGATPAWPSSLVWFCPTRATLRAARARDSACLQWSTDTVG